MTPAQGEGGPELRRGEHKHPEDLITDMCEAILVTVGLLTLHPQPGPQQVSIPLPEARGRVREEAVEILDALAEHGWTMTR